MERLETKQINGQIYYYYSKWGWVDGKCRRVWQKYLGKLENIVKAVESDAVLTHESKSDVAASRFGDLLGGPSLGQVAST
jgi:hypothetical protein